MHSKFACIPTQPSRMDIITKTAPSIAKQVDKLFIYCNNNAQLPQELINIDNIIPIHGEDRGSAARFYICSMQGYLFFCDDDLIYPDGYVNYLCEKIELYERKAVVGYHGKIIKYPMKDIRRDYEKVFRCRESLKTDEFINYIGTGAMAYHSDTLKLNLDCFRHNNLDDAEFSIRCHERNVNMIVVAHEPLEYVPPTGSTIWNDTITDSKPLLDYINAYSSWYYTGSQNTKCLK